MLYINLRLTYLLTYLQMPTSVPNFNLLAPFVSEIWRGSQNKNWELMISPDAFTDQMFTVLVKAYKHTEFQLPSSISFRL